MNRQHFVCAPSGSSAPIEVDPPAAAMPGPRGSGASSLGSAPAPRSGAADPSTRGGQSTHAVGSSAADPSATSTPDPQLVPHSDPVEGEPVLSPSPASDLVESVLIPTAGSSTDTGSGTAAATTQAQGPVTRSQRGIHKPKSYTDGTIRWCMSTQTEEPATVNEALHDPNWAAAMESEHQALLRNKTWHLVPPPKGRNIIGCKWVYKVK